MPDETVSSAIDTFMGSADKGEMRTNLNPSKFVVVDALADLPSPAAGVITLAADTAYFFTSAVDLAGNRIATTNAAAIYGTSTETASITSTGLGSGVPLITTTATILMQDITIKDVDEALSIDGGDTALVGFSAVNFDTVPNIGTIKNVANFIYKDSTILNSKGLIIDENVGTFAVEGSLISPDTGTAITIAATAVISRRFRVIYSAVTVPTGATGINVSTSASIPVEGYILDTVVFSGSGTRTAGVAFDDDKARFLECRGITNSSNIGAYSMQSNATATTITTVSTPVKAAGTTTENTITQRFTHTDNRLTEVSAIVRDYKVTATLTLSSGNNKTVAAYVAKNGTVLSESVSVATTDGNGRFEGMVVQALVNLEATDYIEIWVENQTDTENITVQSLNVIVEAQS